MQQEGQGDNASINTLAPKTDLVAEKTGCVRDAPSPPAFKNTRRLKLSTLVLILYSTLAGSSPLLREYHSCEIDIAHHHLLFDY